MSLNGDTLSLNVLSLERHGPMDCVHRSTSELLGVMRCQVTTNGVSAVTYRQRGGKVCGEINDWLV